MVAALREHMVDLICLAGYMRLLSPWFVQQFPNRILNIHPSLLPAFPGLDAQKQAFEYGVKVSGCTVHFVDADLDHGAIILQKTVPVLDSDDEHALAARILEQEHIAYSEAIRNCAGRQVPHCGTTSLPLIGGTISTRPRKRGSAYARHYKLTASLY